MPAATFQHQKHIFSWKKNACGNVPGPKTHFFTKKTPAATFQDQKHVFFTKKGACGNVPGPKTYFSQKKGACGSTPGPKKTFVCGPGAVKLPFKDTFFMRVEQPSSTLRKRLNPSQKRQNFGSARPENQETNKKWSFSGRKKSSGGVKALYLAYFFEIYLSI